jgi:hypothetical protein
MTLPVQVDKGFAVSRPKVPVSLCSFWDDL